jgi:hypothetical protein
MPAIDLNLQGDGAWPDLLSNERVIECQGPIKMALLRGGMVSGRASVTIRLDLPDGRVVLTQTSLALLFNAVRALTAAPGVVL